MEFEVLTAPQGKARARTFYDNRAGKMRSITPEKTKDYESLIRWSYKAAGGEFYNDEYIKVSITAFYEVPKSWSNKKRNAALSGATRPTTKPDCDNICKAVLDALNGVAYTDDKQVIELSITKHYANGGRLVVNIEPIGGSNGV